jgi:16S rRNA (guanine(966)-N(2))-methyltransferase RsmD
VPLSFKARPTTDFARENLFNVLSNLLEWEKTRALDLFSGTGGIAFEMLSRGCPLVVCVEKDPVHYAFIRKVRRVLDDSRLIAVRGDVFRFIESCNREFDLIFADPPYNLPELGEVPELILRKNLLKDGGRLVMEHPKGYDFSSFPGFEQQRVYGTVHFSIIKKGLV